MRPRPLLDSKRSIACHSDRFSRASHPALRGLELHPPVECVAGIILAGADDHLARSLAGGDDPSTQRTVIVFETILDVIGAQARQAVIDGGEPRRAGVADDLEAALVARGSLRDLLQPGIIGS